MDKIGITRLLQQFQDLFPDAKNPQVARAPGRVNLLGEHTDYNEGFVFPMAIDAGIRMAGALNNSDSVRLYSLDFQADDNFSLKEIAPSTKQEWTNYIRGVCREFQLLGLRPQGMDLIVQGNVPLGAGLSSSAALEVAAAVLITRLQGWTIEHVELVKLAQRAENNFVGVASGIMDQFASMMGKKDHGLFLDCRSLDYELVPLPFKQQGYCVAVVNSGVKRGLVDSEYNTRRQECEDAVNLLKQDLPHITALRDVSIDDLPLVNALPPVLAKRARHVVTENNRVLAGKNALKAGNIETFGRLLNASHLSLKDDFEVSCPELDLLVNLALDVPKVLGARMTGAGFGGCMIALVPQTNLPLFRNTISQRYLTNTGLHAEIYVFNPSAGAAIMTAEELQQS